MMTGVSDFMAETLNDVLSMRKNEEGKLDLLFAPFNINDSISKILSALSGGAIQKSLQLTTDIAADLPTLLLGDVYRVEHMISNLISNSIKFSLDGGAILVKVIANDSAQLSIKEHLPSPNLTVSMSQSSIRGGNSEENQGKLFDGFFQVNPDQLQ